MPVNPDVTILIPGNLRPAAADTIAAQFDVVRIERPDPALITPEIAAKVRGIGCACTINATLIDALPNLEIVASFGVGYGSIDVAHAARAGVTVTNTPDVVNGEAADTTIGHLLNTVRRLPAADRFVREGRWAKGESFPLSDHSLRDRHVGMFGLGRVGRTIAKRVEAFGVPISYHTRRKVEGVPYTWYPSLAGLAEAVDTLIVIVPATPETEKAVDAEILKALGPRGIVISVGRGSTIDEAALVQALQDGTIAGAGMDVFADQPNVPEALLTMDNVCLSPHIGTATIQTRSAMARLVADNLIGWFEQGAALTPVPETAHIRRGD